MSTQAEIGSYGEWQELVLAIFICQELVLAILKVSRDMAEIGSYGEWQEPVLAIFKWQELVLAIIKVSRDRTEICSYGEWQELVLATLKVSRDRLNQLVMGSGKNWFLPL